MEENTKFNTTCRHRTGLHRIEYLVLAAFLLLSLFCTCYPMLTQSYDGWLPEQLISPELLDKNIVSSQNLSYAEYADIIYGGVVPALAETPELQERLPNDSGTDSADNSAFADANSLQQGESLAHSEYNIKALQPDIASNNSSSHALVYRRQDMFSDSHYTVVLQALDAEHMNRLVDEHFFTKELQPDKHIGGYYGIHQEYDQQGRVEYIAFLANPREQDRRIAAGQQTANAALEESDKNNKSADAASEEGNKNHDAAYAASEESNKNNNAADASTSDRNYRNGKTSPWALQATGSGQYIEKREYYPDSSIQRIWYLDKNGKPMALRGSSNRYGMEYYGSRLSYIDRDGSRVFSLGAFLRSNQWLVVAIGIMLCLVSMILRKLINAAERPSLLTKLTAPNGGYSPEIGYPSPHTDIKVCSADIASQGTINAGENCGSKHALRLQQICKILLWGFLLVYIGFILYETVLFRQPGPRDFQLQLFWSYRHILEDNELRLEILNNIWLFVPLGTALGAIFRKWQCIILAMLLSIGIEAIQGYYGIGLCELDDVLDNTMGAVLGYLFYVRGSCY